MAFDTLGRPTNKAVDNVNVFKYRPGQIVDNDVYLEVGDFINPGQDANGNPGIAKQYQGETAGGFNLESKNRQDITLSPKELNFLINLYV